MPAPFERRKEQQNLLYQIDRRNWLLWALSFAITVCLAAAIASFYYPAIRWHVDRIEILYGLLPQLILGLLTLILLCIIYIVLNQRELNDLRNFLIATNLEDRHLSQELPKDTLTGVLDRRALPDVMKREVTWVDRYHVPLSLLLFNVYGFHSINEAEGNLSGDEVLKALARAIEATARQTDTILRYAPDRFLCFLPRTDRKGAEAFGRRVLAACAQNPRLRALSLQFGLAQYRPRGVAEQMLADVERDLQTKSPAPSPAAPLPAVKARGA